MSPAPPSVLMVDGRPHDGWINVSQGLFDLGKTMQTKMTDYYNTYKHFVWDIPETFNFAGDVVDHFANTTNGLALVYTNAEGSEERYHYADISRLSAKLANVLSEHGVRKGDRVVVMFPRQPYWQIAIVACLRLGAVPIPCIEMLTGKDITYRVRHSGAKAAITLARNVDKFADVVHELAVKIAVGGADAWLDYDEAMKQAAETFTPVRVMADDPAIMYYTSGSTGMPKGVMHAARALYSWRVSAHYWLDLHERDMIWCTADTGWSKAGTSILFGPWSCGACAFFYDGPFSAADRLRLLSDYEVTVYCAAGTELLQVINDSIDDFDLRKLRRIVSAGEAVNPVIVERFEEKIGCVISEAYGQTETLMTILNYPCLPVKAGSMGLASPGTQVDVLSGTGELAEHNEIGQIAIRMPNPQVMLCYWQEPKRTADAFLENESGKWFLSGDLAYKDAQGYFYYSGRTDDMINSAGYRIGPFEVESALLEHPAVQECAVVASPDEERGSVVKAFIVAKHGVEKDDGLVESIKEHVKQATAPYKYPRKVEFVQQLPKTLTGKIKRRQLRDQEFAHLEQS